MTLAGPSDLSSESLIINLAPTGAVADPARNPNLPVTEEAIFNDVLAGARLGVSICHLHVREADGRPSASPQRFAALIRRIRAHPETRRLILCATTSGRHGQSDKERAAVLELPDDARPDMGSLTLGSLNFPGGVSVNPPETIRLLAKTMLERGIHPELEIFDSGMIHFAHRLIREGLLRPPYYFNLLLGNIGGSQVSLHEVATLVGLLPEPCVWSLAGIARSQKTAVGLGALIAPGVRIGLEDNLWRLDSRDRQPASNTQLIEWVARLAACYGRSLARPDDVRQQLGMAA